LNKLKTLFNGVFQFVKNKLSKLLANKRASSLFFIGLLNGLLPCGLVYLGIAGAISTGNFQGGASYMMLFGLGTFPAMLLMFAIKPLLGSTALQKIRRLIPYFIFILGCLFILRGLNLGIPYLSPDIDKPVDDIENCELAVS
jgi:sulfite exporter TauE/SafE